MKLHELTEWHWKQVAALTEQTEVTINEDATFAFFSGSPKLGSTTLVPTEGGFEVKERYETHTLSKEYHWENLTQYLYQH